MEYKLCKICDEFHYTNRECAPEYNVYHEDYLGEDPKKVRAFGFQDAVLKYGEYYNSNSDYSLMDETIEVKVERNGIIKYFNVSAEPDIHYSSKEINKS